MRAEPQAARRGRWHRAFPLLSVLDALAAAAREWRVPAMELVAAQSGDPFRVLVGTLLSLRTRDATTLSALARLTALAPDAPALARTAPAAVAAAIRPVAFHRVKAERLVALAGLLCERHGGAVPADRAALLALPGVGPKTAALTLQLGFGRPAVCVDTHVHRILNRLGALHSPTPAVTEALLRRHLPQERWNAVNPVLVAFGQTLCTPLSPWCSRCPVAADCRRVGVGRRR